MDNLGFTITPRRSREKPADLITDLDFTADIALLSDTLNQAQELLSRVGGAAEAVGLQINTSKTKVMAYNGKEDIVLSTKSGNQLEQISNILARGWINQKTT